jgi:hypothetical protein
MEEIISKYIEIFSILASVIVLVISIITNIISSIKQNKNKTFYNIILDLIKQAETLTNFSGVEKKTFVMIKALDYAIKHKIKFDEQTVNEKLEQLIDLSKNVNANSDNLSFFYEGSENK